MKFPRFLSRFSVGRLWLVGLAFTICVGGLTWNRWWPVAQNWVQSTISSRKATSSLDDHDHGTGAHDHDHGDHQHAHDDANSLELSRQAMASIGLDRDSLQPVKLETFYRSITVPALLVERPERTQIPVSTPMAGVVTHVHAVRGEAVVPGMLLFEIRITADELVSTQTELLKTLGNLDVENREIARLEEVTRSGAVAQKTLLERQYAKDKLEVLLLAQKEALRLQGLSDQQVDDIVKNRRLLRDLQVRAPQPDEHSEDELELISGTAEATGTQAVHSLYEPHPDSKTPLEDQSPLILQQVYVSKGERIPAGKTMALLSDMSELYVEGRAFEQDVDLITRAAANNWQVSAIFDLSGQRTEIIDDLELLYAASQIDEQSRTLHFYARLPNQLVRDVPSPNGLRFIEWRFRPGQRLRLRVPVEEWADQIVLPVEAVAQDGAESFVFQQNGNHFDRVAVHVAYRDQISAVIKNDGSIFPGDVIALRGAYQMQMALKNQSGGGVDPHAGHNH